MAVQFSDFRTFSMCDAFLGGGVMGSPGWNAALTVMTDLKHH